MFDPWKHLYVPKLSRNSESGDKIEKYLLLDGEK